MRVAAVVPVRGQPDLLAGCLDALRAQVRAPDDIVVVDDSPESILALAGDVREICSGGRGPYAARNVGWRATEADVVLFLDARSRPTPAWVGALAAAFDDPSVALAGSDTIVEDGPGLGARAAHAQQSFRTTYYVERPFFRPYLPTCNLGVARRDLEAVGGFSEVRSGADADFCWRVLSDKSRRLVVVPGELMTWVPRPSIREYLEQNHRYGRSNHALRAAWGAPPRAALPPLVLGRRIARTVLRFAVASARRDDERLVATVRDAAWLANELGYASAARAARRAEAHGPPTPLSVSA